MKFQQYLQEGKTIQIIPTKENFDAIIKECSQWLKIIGNYEVLRTVRNVRDTVKIIKKEVRNDRVPKGTDNETFKNFNKWARANGIPGRDESVSVSVDLFGSVSDTFIFLAAGKFKYAWVHAKDFNISYGKSGWMGWTPNFVWGDDETIRVSPNSQLADWAGLNKKDDMDYAGNQYDISKKDDNGAPEMLIKTVKEKMIVNNKAIKTALKNGYEIWVKCDYYYAIPFDIWKVYKP